MKNSTIKTDRKDDADPSQTQLRDEASMTVNAPFRDRQFAANKKLTPEEISALEAAMAEGEQLRFAVVGDLNIKNHYARSVLAVTDRQMAVRIYSEPWLKESPWVFAARRIIRAVL